MGIVLLVMRRQERVLFLEGKDANVNSSCCISGNIRTYW